MTPEQSLLLLCANPYPTRKQAVEIGRLTRSRLDWQEVVAQAGKHGLSQLLFHTIQQIEGADLPEPVQQPLKQHFDRTVRKNLFLTAELIRIINLLDEAGITAVPFKGPVLAEKLYGNLALRIFIDLDILIPLEDREAVRSLLEADGYRYHEHPDSAYQFINHQSNIVLELHWEAISLGTSWLRTLKEKPLPTTLTHLTPRLMKTTLGGKEIDTLSPEDSLLILTIHGSKHWWSRLNWLSDIAALLHLYPALDWQWILEQVNYWHIRRPVFLGLYLAHNLLGAALPDLILAQVSKEPQIDKLARQVQSMFFIEQNFYTRYIKRPAYFRNLWDMEEERRTLLADHLSLYLELFRNLFRKQPVSRK